ncbi:hypothetical protein G3I19_01205 [Streptomyces sp. SID10853]|uniref:DUF6716 putative glycosyltransferase n=1 Tax=Streptomyces sp. SID10853 TaxID=2706028 RepID=UPI0013BFEF06|nr:hypothetical protein [Streptomyces sp. SID10853]
MIADSDTRWKWGALTARRLSVGDTRLSGFLLRGRATPTPRQLAEVGAGVDTADVREVTGAEFLRAVEDDGYDVVVLALVGGAVQAMLHGLAALTTPAVTTSAVTTSAVTTSAVTTPALATPALATSAVSTPARRPVVVTGYVGVVYEKLADGLLLRHGADVVLANSPHDAARFRAVYEGVGADASAVTCTALPFLGGAPYAGDTLRTVVFAAQPSVPASRADRTYLLRRLAEHARLHPDREVLLKLRSQPGEHTTHIEELPYQKLAEKLPGGLPANFRLVYGHMGEVLDRTDLLVTVSSTAALESLHRRIPTAVLTDLGIREALGNHHFLGSGCLASWDQLDSGTSPEADPGWLADQGVAAGPETPGGVAPGRETTGGETTGREVPAGGAPAREVPAEGAPDGGVSDGRVPDGRVPDGRVPDGGAPDGEAPRAGAPYDTAFDAARERVARLLLDPGLPPIQPYYTLATAPGYLPGILARYRLDAAPDTGTGGVRRVVRDAVRDAARGAYRHGVQRVAPVIRRMGEL